MKILVVVPTYNEAENIQQLIDQLDSNGYSDILVVDDNSTDGTADIVTRLSRNNERIHLIQRPGKLGLGSAYVDGFRYALSKGYSYIVQMDCDLSHSPDDVSRLLEPILKGEADVVIGSRYVKGGQIEGWGISRLLLSWGGNLYAKILLGFGIKDWTAGFKAFNSEALQKLLTADSFAEGYAFQVEMNYRALQSGSRLVEVPIVFRDRVRGDSKMGHTIIREAVSRVWRVRFECSNHTTNEQEETIG